MRQPTQRELQAEERRNQLVDVSLRLIAKKGFERITIKDISEAAGVAKDLIYHYFGSKEALLFAAVDRHGFCGGSKLTRNFHLVQNIE